MTGPLIIDSQTLIDLGGSGRQRQPTRDIVFNVGATPNPLGWHVDQDCHVLAAWSEVGGLVILSTDARNSWVSGTVQWSGVICGGNVSGSLMLAGYYPMKKDSYLWVYIANVPSRVHVIIENDIVNA